MSKGEEKEEKTIYGRKLKKRKPRYPPDNVSAGGYRGQKTGLAALMTSAFAQLFIFMLTDFLAAFLDDTAHKTLTLSLKFRRIRKFAPDSPAGVPMNYWQKKQNKGPDDINQVNNAHQPEFSWLALSRGAAHGGKVRPATGRLPLGTIDICRFFRQSAQVLFALQSIKSSIRKV